MRQPEDSPLLASLVWKLFNLPSITEFCMTSKEQKLARELPMLKAEDVWLCRVSHNRSCGVAADLGHASSAHESVSPWPGMLGCGAQQPAIRYKFRLTWAVAQYFSSGIYKSTCDHQCGIVPRARRQLMAWLQTMLVRKQSRKRRCSRTRSRLSHYKQCNHPKARFLQLQHRNIQVSDQAV